MTKQDQKKVAAILSWKDNDDAARSKSVTVRYRDDSETTLSNVGIGAWLRIKEEEFQHELDGLDAGMLDRIVSRYTRATDRESFISSCRRSDDYHLCAWCQCYVSKDDEIITLQLTPEEFEATRHTGESHGICKQCKDAQIAAKADMRNNHKSPPVDRQNLADVEAVRAADESLLDSLREQISTFESPVEKLRIVETKVNALEDELVEMAEVVSRVERERDEAQDDMDNYEAKVLILESDFEKSEVRVIDLQAELNNIKRNA